MVEEMAPKETVWFGDRFQLYEGPTDELPSLVFEVPKEGQSVQQADLQQAYNPRRHRAAKTIYVVKPAPVQSYLTRDLHQVVHYNLAAEDLPNLLQIKGPRIVVIEASEDYTDEAIAVRNNHPEALKNMPPIKEMMEELLEQPIVADRNHRRIDVGCMGHKSSTRADPDSLGLAKPGFFSRTFTFLGQAIILACTAVLLNVFPECAGCTYDDEERNAIFAKRACRGSNFQLANVQAAKIESAAGGINTFIRNGIVVKEQHLGPHTDIGNDSTVPSYSAVIGTSVLVYEAEVKSVHRAVNVGYGKHAAYQYLCRLHRYQDILVQAYQVWEELPRIEKVVDTSLFPDPNQEPEGKYLDSPHTQKTVYYSSFRHVICWFCEVYTQLARQPLLLPGLLFCITVSPAPQHYWYELRRIIQNPGIFAEQGHPSVNHMDATEFTRCLYDHLFEAKSQAQPYRTVNRHQPSHNQRAAGAQLENSLDAIARLIYELNRVPGDSVRRQIGYYHSRALAVLRLTCPRERVNVWEGPTAVGVYGAGSLTAQHILGVASGVGCVQDCLLTHAEIAAGTSSWAYLASFGLDESKFREHSETILAAISYKLDIHRVQAEELCCATNQVSHDRERPSEWIPPGAPILRCLPRETKEGPLVELLHPNGNVTSLPLFALNFRHDYFQQRNRSLSRAYWDVKTDYRLPRKKHYQRQGFQPGFFFPMIPPAGYTQQRAKASGLLGVPIPSPQSIIFARDPRIKLVADIAGGVRKVLQTFYRRGEQLHEAKDSVIFVVEERLLQLDQNKKPLCVVTRKEIDTKRLPKRMRGENNRPTDIKRPTDRVTHFQVYSCAIMLGGGKLFRPNPDFPLREDYFLEDGVASHQVIGTRWFRSKKDAKQYCSLAFLAVGDPATSSCFFRHLPGFGDRPVLLHGPVTNRSSPPEGNAEVRVQVYTTRQNRQSQVPKFISVTYESGARAFFLTDGSGARVSGLTFLLPFPLLGERCYEAILRHRGAKSETELEVRWSDGAISWEPIARFEGRMDWPVLKYAKCMDMLGEPHWKRFAGMEKSLPDLTMPAILV